VTTRNQVVPFRNLRRAEISAKSMISALRIFGRLPNGPPTANGPGAQYPAPARMNAIRRTLGIETFNETRKVRP
jgi:hypothetical protein